MRKNTFKLTLDQKATYRIKVPGEVRKINLGVNEIQIDYEQNESKDQLISVMTCTFDQAGLLGFLRRLYAMGLPLIEVTCLDFTF